jgi:hypothetical protein
MSKKGVERRLRILVVAPLNSTKEASMVNNACKWSIGHGLVAQFELPEEEEEFVIDVSGPNSLQDVLQLDALVVVTTATILEPKREKKQELIVKEWSFNPKWFSHAFQTIQKDAFQTIAKPLKMDDPYEVNQLVAFATLQGVPVLWVALVPWVTASVKYPYPFPYLEKIEPIPLKDLWEKKTSNKEEATLPVELQDQSVHILFAHCLDENNLRAPNVYYSTPHYHTRDISSYERKLEYSNFYNLQSMLPCTRRAQDIIHANLLTVIPHHSLALLVEAYSNPCISSSRQVAHLFTPKTSTSALFSCQSDLWIAQRLSELVQTIQKQKGKKDASAIVGPFSYSYCSKHKRHSLHIPFSVSKIAQKTIQKAANQLASKGETFLLL